MYLDVYTSDGTICQYKDRQIEMNLCRPLFARQVIEYVFDKCCHDMDVGELVIKNGEAILENLGYLDFYESFWENQQKKGFVKDLNLAIQQMKDKHYTQTLENYTGSILFIGINYNKKSKVHECSYRSIYKIYWQSKNLTAQYKIIIYYNIFTGEACKLLL